VPAQDQVICINYFKNKIFEEVIVSKCQFFKQEEETIDYLTSECPFMLNNECLMGHDEVYAHLHYSICRAVDIRTMDRYTHTCPNQYVNMKMLQCYGIKWYTQTEKLE